ncbi:hypothetical protein M378DRAFT_156795 [Amanita muscaria Koide BX008]|uniref:Uncharacterized protein n=1 Tax=Amanita muscaria (strain Koide BX008) TaxID=946122 RepID=A0A0C2XJG1_AMAMK|nr:hypothetical protein M378DRAFT_156795 [Amanita muscaria Koide BX008]
MILRLSVLLWLFAIHLIGIYLFTRGFLLSRLSLSNHSICPDEFSNCTLPPTHKRAVLLIIDSLRFDFISPQPPLPSSPHHHNVLTLPKELTEKYPTRSFIFNAYADPPTTTLQRIKGLTTGSLPTFIDMGNNFGGSSIMEDSILNQLNLAGKISAFMGDDTWMSVFPDAFHPNMTFPYDSFNVEDLHTVDEGVITHLFPLLNDDSKPFDFLIGHFLGVDHVGHRVGPDHSSMTAKLKQMNDVLTRVVEEMDDETLLVVLGDHGMDRSGDHGGDGVLETSAALWIYSKGPELSASKNISPSGLLQYKTFPDSPTEHRRIQQIDILPTLSILLGLPIPYNNLGSVIPEVFCRPTRKGSRTEAPREALKRALEINAAQIKTFLDTYRSSSSGSELDDAWGEIQRSWDAIQQTALSNNTQDIQLLSSNSFNRVALAACRSMWAQFDPILMGFGLAVLFAGLISTCFVYVALKKVQNDWHNWVKKHIPYCVFGAGIGAVLGVCVDFLVSTFVSGVSLKVLDWVLVFASMFSCLAMIVTSMSTSTSSLKLSNAFTSLPIIPIIHTCAFFSNSWTFWEERIVPFLLVTSVLVNFVPAGFTAPTPHLRRRILKFSAVILVCVRLMAISTVCREEQQPYCHVTFFASSSVPSPPLVILILALPTAVVIVPLMIQRILRITKSDAGIANVFVSIIVRPSLVAGTLFWIAEWVDSAQILGGGSREVHHQFWAAELRGVRTWLARFAFGWPVLVGLSLWWAAPLCMQVDVDVTNDEKPGAGKTNSQPTRRITILGFANAFGASYLMFWMPFFCVVYASLQLTAQVVLGLALVALLSYLEVVDSVRDARMMESAFATGAPSSILAGSSTSPSLPSSASASAATQLQFSEIVPIALLGLLTFYATGHQATVSSIQWKAAFMLTETVRYPWAPLTVGINSLGPVAVISGFGVVLLAVWNREPGLSDQKPGQAHNEEGSTQAISPRERYDAQVTADSTLAGLGIMMYYGAILLATAMSAAILRRHLMVWKVFAPRFMAAVIHLLVVDVGALVGVGVGVGRISNRIGTVFRGMVRE